MPPEVPTDPPAPRRFRPRPRVGLRTLCLGIAAIAAALAPWVNQARTERLAARWVESHGGRLAYADQLDEDGGSRKAVVGPITAWLRRALGDPYVRRIGRVQFPATAGPIRPDDLAHLAGLSGLRWLSLAGPGVDDRHLARIRPLHRLEGLALEDARPTDDGLRHLAGLRRLRSLDLSGTPITDAGLAHLRGLRELTDLDLSGTKVAGPGLAHLAGLDRLESLDFNGTPLDDAGLARLPKLPRLDNLVLGGGIWVTEASGRQHIAGGITDAGLRHLEQYPGLRWLQFVNSTISGPALERLLPQFSRLEHLGLHYTNVSLEDYRRIVATYPRLETGFSR